MRHKIKFSGSVEMVLNKPKIEPDLPNRAPSPQPQYAGFPPRGEWNRGTGTMGVLNLRELSHRKRTSIQEKRSFVPALIPVGPAKSNCQFGAAHLQTKDDTSDKMVADPYGAASRISRCSPRSNQKAPNS